MAGAGTAPPDDPAGVDRDGVTAWFRDHVDDLAPPLRFDIIAGGRSNLTFDVHDADGRRWVLRRPPLHGVLPSAHDMGREHRIISALATTDVPVPPTVGFCADPDVTGAPFYVMEHVDGAILRGAEVAEEALDPAGRRRAGEDLVDVLVRLHSVDPDAVGLGDLAKKEDYIARQLHRWFGQYEKGGTRELPLIEDVHDRLAKAIPAQGPAAIVHGDYRLDNLILSPEGEVRAVLDWELCTLGDPLADVGLLMVYWAEPGDESIPLLDAPTVVDGFLGRVEVAQRYAERSRRDLAELDYYVAFAYWKLALILEGVYTRFAAGAYGDHEDEGVKQFAEVVLRLGERADEALRRVGR
ncbi:MAG: phosphotransferase family protein [Actinobacteria bacterium]|nr:phosphotransferase family protein [Actinomycetota bacterium]